MGLRHSLTCPYQGQAFLCVKKWFEAQIRGTESVFVGVQWGGKRTFLTCSVPYSTDQILGRRCVRECGSNNLQSETVIEFDVIFLETCSPAQVLT